MLLAPRLLWLSGAQCGEIRDREMWDGRENVREISFVWRFDRPRAKRQRKAQYTQKQNRDIDIFLRTY